MGTTAGGTYIIDTGSPISVGRQPTLQLGGEAYPLLGRYLSATPDEMSELVGRRVDGLIGLDILNRYDCIFDAPKQELQLTTATYIAGGAHLQLQLPRLPVLGATINDRSARVYLDTGAQIGYLRPGLLAAHPTTGSTYEDFFPGLGRFTTETWQVPVTLGTTVYTFTYGKLPSALSGVFSAFEGVVGIELLYNRLVVYAPRRGQLVVGTLAGKGVQS